MIDNIGLKLAVSALAIGTTMVGCTATTGNARPGAASLNSTVSGPAAFHAQAQKALQEGAYASAVAPAERAVELAPNDAAYRMLLGQAYLKNGRFQSAETTFGDVVALDPGNSRAGLNRVLAQIALGKTGEALANLENLSGSAAPADIGLAYALAGDARRAVQMLEPAARAEGADARIRQNLALAYAMAGQWSKAQTTAAQDVSPADLGARMQQWARFSQPKASWDQVASLLNVSPSEDRGQPVRLALAAPAANQAYAEAASEPVQAIGGPAPVEEAEVRLASAEPASTPVQSVDFTIAAPEATAPAVADNGFEAPSQGIIEESQPVYAAAVQTLVAPQSAVSETKEPVFLLPENSFRSAPRSTSRSAPTQPANVRPVRQASSRFVLQLGAFSQPSGVERAWSQAYRRFGFGDQTPLSTTVTIPGRGTFHRLSVAGFETHTAASRACKAVRSKGGVCFVRALAGDAPVRWASRYINRRG